MEVWLKENLTRNVGLRQNFINIVPFKRSIDGSLVIPLFFNDIVSYAGLWPVKNILAFTFFQSTNHRLKLILDPASRGMLLPVPVTAQTQRPTEFNAPTSCNNHL